MRKSDEMLALLERQRDLSVRLKELAGRQRLLIAEDDPSALLGLLAERRKVMERLGEVTSQVGPRPERLMEGMCDAGARERAEGLLGQTRRNMREVMEGDSQDVRRLEVRRRDVSTRLGAISGRAAMLRAYGSSSSGVGVLDQTDGG